MPTSSPVARHRSIGTKLISLLALPLVALVALWGFSGSITFGAALQMAQAKNFNDKLLQPTQRMVEMIQQERRISIAYLAGDPRVDRAALEGPRARTDRARSTFQTSILDKGLRRVMEPDTAERADELSGRLGEIDTLRRSINDRLVARQPAFDEFNSLIDHALGIYARVDPKNAEMARDARTLTLWAHAQELMNREDALVVGVLTAGRYTVQEREQFAQYVSAQRDTLAATEPYLPPADLARFQRFLSSAELGRFRALEDRMIREGGRPTVQLDVWRVAAGGASTRMYDMGMASIADVTDRAEHLALIVILQLGFAGGLGLIAIIISVLVAVRIGRRLMREFRGLAKAVNHFSNERLPEVAELARGGEPIDPDHG
ncbi:MAG: nitrate- and nitrite sensing domain-containing protein, partial [Actinomadura sp.]